MAGEAKRKVPRNACCWVCASEEMNSPTPTTEARKKTIPR
jgi:hypothetical protein